MALNSPHSWEPYWSEVVRSTSHRNIIWCCSNMSLACRRATFRHWFAGFATNNHSRTLSLATTWLSKAPRRTAHPEQLGTVQDNPEQPRAAESSQGQSRATRNSTKQPRVTQSSPKQPSAARNSTQQPRAVWNGPKQPRADQSGQQSAR